MGERGGTMERGGRGGATSTGLTGGERQIPRSDGFGRGEGVAVKEREGKRMEGDRVEEDGEREREIDRDRGFLCKNTQVSGGV